MRGIPYVMPVHDLQHRLQPQFAEVSANGELQGREELFRPGIENANAVLVDSEAGKEDVLNLYDIPEDRVHVVPFVPMTPPLPHEERKRWAASLRRTHELPSRFVFYPAQFWKHKNHVRLIRAVDRARRVHGIDVGAVFVGIPYNGFDEAMAAIEELGLQKIVRYLGYVRDEEVAALYFMADALVMPTFFGPTNIPDLEAWKANCPVVTSDVRGIREQVADAALLVDPYDADQLGDTIAQVLTDAELRQRITAKGLERVAAADPTAFQAAVIRVLRGCARQMP